MKDIDEAYDAPDSFQDYLAQSKKSAETLRWIWDELICANGRWRIKTMLIWLVCGVLLSLIPSWILGKMVDTVKGPDGLIVYVIMSCIGTSMMASLICRLFQQSAREWALGYIMRQVDKRLSELFFEKSVGQHIQEGGTLSAANVEKARGRVWHVVDSFMFQGSAILLYLGISYVLLWSVSFEAGAGVTILFGHYLAWMVFLNRRVMKEGAPIDKAFREHNAYRSDRWDLAERVLNCGKAKEEIGFMAEWFDRIIERDRPLWLWFIRNVNIRAMIETVFFLGILWFGIMKVRTGQMPVGNLVPLYVWTLGIIQNLWYVGEVERMVNWNMPAIESMREALETPPDIVIREDAVRLSAAAPLSVEIENVSYSYPPEEGDPEPPHILKNVSFRIKPGEKVALVGPSGAGKSTIVRLLLRNMDPTSGRVLYDGHDLRDVDLDHLRRQIGEIAQRPPVLDDTLCENVLYRIPRAERTQISDEDVWQVLDTVQLGKDSHFARGLDTRVGKNGVKLSGGEQQRLMIAAAIIARLRFIIIDEATSSLDSITEQLVQRGIEKMLQNGTSALIIAHRFSTILFCDKVVVLRKSASVTNGGPQIEAVGTFQEVLRVSPTFKELARRQNLIMTSPISSPLHI